MGSLGEVKTTFTIDLAPYLEGLKTMLTLTQQTGVQLKPLLNLQIDKADFSQLEKTFGAYAERVKATIPLSGEAAQASTALGGAAEVEEKKVRKSSQSHEEQALSLRTVKRDALQGFGAIAFLTQGITQLAASNSQGNKQLEKLNQGLSQGVSAGFGLAGILGTLGVASGGTAVLIGAVATVVITLVSVLNKAEDTTARNEKLQNDFARTLSGMTIPQLELYRRKIIEVILAGQKQVEFEKNNQKTRTELLNENYTGLKREFEIFKQFLGIKIASQATEDSLLRAKEQNKTLDDEIAGKTKTQAEIDLFIRQSKIDSLVRANDRERAEAKKTYDEEIIMIIASASSNTLKEEAKAVAAQKYNTKIREIRSQELKEALDAAKQITEVYLKVADDRFEGELNRARSAGLRSGVNAETLDLQMITARKARFQQQLNEISKIAGPLSPEALQKQVQLETQVTQLAVQEAEKRKSIKQAEKDFIDSLADLSLQGELTRVRLRGIALGQSEEQINIDVIARKKMAIDAEQKLLNEKEASGKQLDDKEKLRKEQLEKDLDDLTLEGVNARKALAEQESQAKMDAIQGIASNMSAAFSQLAEMQQKNTSKTVGEEKKKKQAALDTQKASLLAAATTDAERQRIEQDFADKKALLDAEMDQKAQGMNKAAFDRQKAMSIIAATISTYEAATKALAAAPPPFNFILAAAVTAAGLVNVAMINSQEVPGMAEGGRLKKGQRGFFEGYGPEIVAPEESFIQVFKDDLAPRLIEVLLPQIKASVLAAIAVPGSGGGGNIFNQTFLFTVESFAGTPDDFERLKKTIEDAMQQAGRSTLVTLFRNPQQRQRAGIGWLGGTFISEG